MIPEEPRSRRPGSPLNREPSKGGWAMRVFILRPGGPGFASFVEQERAVRDARQLEDVRAVVSLQGFGAVCLRAELEESEEGHRVLEAWEAGDDAELAKAWAAARPPAPRFHVVQGGAAGGGKEGCRGRPLH